MKWIRWEVSSPDHPLVHELATSLHIAPALALGHYVAVCCRMGEHREDGRLGAVPDKALETWALWTGRKGRFALALRQLCQTEDGQMKGWWRQERLRQRAENERERMREVRKELGERTANSLRTKSERAAANDTIRNGTVRKEEQSSTAPPAPGVIEVMAQLPLTSHAAFAGHLRASRNPDALVRELIAMHDGLRGAVYPWDVLGRTLEELAVDGGPCSAVRLRAFAKRIMTTDPSGTEDAYDVARRELEAEGSHHAA